MPGTCDAHALLVGEVQRMQNGQNEIYNEIKAVREDMSDRSKEIVALQKDVAHLTEGMDEVKAAQNEQNKKLDAIFAALPKAPARKSRMTPRLWVTIIVAVLAVAGSSGLWAFLDHRVKGKMIPAAVVEKSVER
jgi:seryl-tRNA synthetase